MNRETAPLVTVAVSGWEELHANALLCAVSGVTATVSVSVSPLQAAMP